MKIETVKCDGCGAVKGENNHWWKIAINNEYHYHYDALGIYHADDLKGAAPYLDMCGEACVIKKVSEFLGQKVS